jgi:hypothetical protein
LEVNLDLRISQSNSVEGLSRRSRLCFIIILRKRQTSTARDHADLLETREALEQSSKLSLAIGFREVAEKEDLVRRQKVVCHSGCSFAGLGRAVGK